jgi:hypothetical protein
MGGTDARASKDRESGIKNSGEFAGMFRRGF